MSQNVHAPQLESSLGWLNTDRPLRIGEELSGQVVLLDFWTLCCINCIHILPDLAYLEDKYADQPLVVIGVHSAKFTNEASRQSIQAAIHRYEIDHPVIVDENMGIWRAYGARSWPTFVLIDPEGYVVETLAGEGNREKLDASIAKLLDTHRAKGTLADAPLAVQRDAMVEPATGLAFPGKVLAVREAGLEAGLEAGREAGLEAGRENDRIFIADSNHNRILVTTWPRADGACRLVQTIGSGAIGADDGPPDQATFDHPQGLALSDDTLYVADTENHLIRAVDLETWNVTTVIGTGEMGYDRAGGAMGVQQEISTPWDLAMEGGTLYIAMAGLHQIWRAEMPIGFARALAGTGRENIVDGPVEQAALSQPSGICLHKGNLFFADSEVSAIRGIDLATEQVSTVIGQGLFVFGDVDGVHPRARLQHPLGVASWGDVLLVADTYNHKIKSVDPGSRAAVSLYGTGEAGTSAEAGGLALCEPGGLDVSGDTLFVADTNNHRVVMVDLKSHAWSELKIEGLTVAAGSADMQADVLDVAPLWVGPDGIDLRLSVTLPPDAHLNAEAPTSLRVIDGTGRILAQKTEMSDAWPISIHVPNEQFHADEKMIADTEADEWLILLTFVYCTGDQASLCIPGEITWRIPLNPAAGESSTLDLSAQLSKEDQPS